MAEGLKFRDIKKATLFIFLVILGIQVSRASNGIIQENYPPIFYSYEINNNGKFQIYVKIQKNEYVLFNVVHEVSPKEFKNLWRLKESYLCTYDGAQMKSKYQVLTGGENEFVWFSDRPGVADATGGFHGNERIDLDTTSYIHFVADNKRINLSKDIPLTSCSSFFYDQYSTMHQVGTGGLINSPNYIPAKGYPIDCFHQKKTTFENNGFTTYNKVIWVDNKALVDRVYYGIFCVSRNISEKGYNDITDTEKKEVITFNEDGSFKLKSPLQRIVMYNKSRGISVTCDATIIKGDNFQLNTSVWDHEVYHKYYSAIDNDTPIKTYDGEIWETESRIRFDLNSIKNRDSSTSLK